MHLLAVGGGGSGGDASIPAAGAGAAEVVRRCVPSSTSTPGETVTFQVGAGGNASSVLHVGRVDGMERGGRANGDAAALTAGGGSAGQSGLLAAGSGVERSAWRFRDQRHVD